MYRRRVVDEELTIYYFGQFSIHDESIEHFTTINTFVCKWCSAYSCRHISALKTEMAAAQNAALGIANSC